MRHIISFIILASLFTVACGDIEKKEVPPAFVENSYDHYVDKHDCKDISNYDYFISTDEYGREPPKFLHYGDVAIPFGIITPTFIKKEELQRIAKQGFPSKKLADKKPLLSSKLDYDTFAIQSWATGRGEDYGAIYIDGVDVRVNEGPHFRKWATRIDVYFRDGWGEYEEDFVGSWHESTGWKYDKCLNIEKYFDSEGRDHVFLKVWLKDIPNKKVEIEPRIHVDLYF